MLVKNWMSGNVITVDVNDSMYDVMKIFEENDIRRTPVMSKGKLVGIITDRDVRRVTRSEGIFLGVKELIDLTRKVSLKENMTKNPVTVPIDYTIEETAVILLDSKISGVPVVDHSGNVVGIITQADIFRALASLTGVKEKGIQFALEISDAPGSIKSVTDAIRREGGHLVSVLTAYDRAPKGHRNVYIRSHGIDRDRLSLLEEQIQEYGKILYLIDHEQNRREIY